MKTTIARILFAALLVAVVGLLSGCQSLMSQGSTRLRVVTPGGVQVDYVSPKDQHIEYDPATGKVVVKSSTNQALAESAAATQAEAIKAMAEAMRTIAPLVKPTP